MLLSRYGRRARWACIRSISTSPRVGVQRSDNCVIPQLLRRWRLRPAAVRRLLTCLRAGLRLAEVVFRAAAVVAVGRVLRLLRFVAMRPVVFFRISFSTLSTTPDINSLTRSATNPSVHGGNDMAAIEFLMTSVSKTPSRPYLLFRRDRRHSSRIAQTCRPFARPKERNEIDKKAGRPAFSGLRTA